MTQMLLTGGLGDVFALEPYFPDRDQIKSMFFDSWAHEELIRLFKLLPNYRQDLHYEYVKGAKVDPSQDWSISVRFPLIVRNDLKDKGSSFLEYKLTEITQKLPEKYIVVVPNTPNDLQTLPPRTFSNDDWDELITFLSINNIHGVILNTGNLPVREHNFLINLTNKTSMAEAIEILKQAQGYIGIDSSLSVLAARLFSNDRLLVKSRSNHLSTWKRAYYPTKWDFSFIVNNLSALKDKTWPSEKINLNQLHNCKLIGEVSAARGVKTVYENPAIYAGDKARTITLTVVQGLGDIFWVYQKFSPYFDVINFNILVLYENDLQTRSVEWLKLFPKVKKISLEVVSNEDYTRVVRTKSNMDAALSQWSSGANKIEFACNAWLESGVRIDEIDPDRPIETTVPIRCSPKPFEKYVLIYVSSGTIDHAWPLDKWADLIEEFYQKYDLCWPAVIIGASFDSDAISGMAQRLQKQGRRVKTFTQAEAEYVGYLIKEAEFMIGFQSGLCILADNFDTKQLMLYYDILNDMRTTWVKRKNIDDKVFHSALFSEKPADIIDHLDVKLDKSILLTCGIGDFIAIETFINESERNSVREICWATRKSADLAALAKVVFPNLEKQTVVFDNFGAAWTPMFCFASKEDLYNKIVAPINLEHVDDYNVVRIGKQFFAGHRSYHGSTLLSMPLADVNRFNLPSCYFVVHPYSDNARTPVRDLTESEWHAALSYLKLYGYKAVILNKGEEKLPSDASVIDLTNQTTLLESLEIVKGCRGFIGASSCLSVMASKVCEANNLFIKGSEDLRDNWSKFYYQPHLGTIVYPNLNFLGF